MKYLAYISLTTKEGLRVFAVIGKDSEDILANSVKYGSDPYFISGMYELGPNW